MTPEHDALRKVAEAATPGPWQTNGSHIYGPDPDRQLVAQSCGSRVVADRDYIATFDPPTVLGLLDAIAALSAEVKSLRDYITEVPSDATQSAANQFAGAMFIATADSEGEILAGDDGEYIYWPKGCHGAFSAWTLRVFADELDRRTAALKENEDG